MNHKEKQEEEVEFWLSYISKWEANHNEPIPERVQLLLENALLKRESYCPDKKQAPLLQRSGHTIH